MQEYGGHIGPREGSVLLFTLLASMLFLQMPQVLVDVAGPAAWQVAILVTLLGVVITVPMIALAHRFPGLSLAEISVLAAGPVLGPLLTLAVSAWLVVATMQTLRNFTETFVMSILPDTPPSMVILFGTLIAIFASYKGVEAIARAAYVLLPAIAAGVLLILLLSLPRADLSLLFPFWGRGIDRTLVGGLYYSSTVAESIALLASGYAFHSGGDFQRSTIRGILLFGLSSAMTVAVMVGVTGSAIAGQNPYPLFYLARLVYLGRFLQRIEAIFVMFWVFAAVTRLAALYHATAVSLAGALRLPRYRPILFPLGPIFIALSLLPKDYVTVLRLERDWMRQAGFVVLAIPLLLWLAAAVRRKEVSAGG